MGILPDKWIREQALKGMIAPFEEKQASSGVISYGVSSYGYDARVANKFKIFHNLRSEIIDPKTTKADYFIEHEGDDCVIPPNSYVLAHTVETFKIPRDVLVICLGKSTYARWGIIVNVTPLEPEWEGTVTLEISNATPCPVKIYANEGICQLAFFKADSVCETSYADRKGKYQGQSGITLGKISDIIAEPETINGDVDIFWPYELMETLPKLAVQGRVRIRYLATQEEVAGAFGEFPQMRFSISRDEMHDAIIVKRIV